MARRERRKAEALQRRLLSLSRKIEQKRIYLFLLRLEAGETLREPSDQKLLPEFPQLAPAPPPPPSSHSPLVSLSPNWPHAALSDGSNHQSNYDGRGREERQKVAVVGGRQRKCFDQRWWGCGGGEWTNRQIHGNLLATHLLL